MVRTALIPSSILDLWSGLKTAYYEGRWTTDPLDWPHVLHGPEKPLNDHHGDTTR